MQRVTEKRSSWDTEITELRQNHGEFKQENVQEYGMSRCWQWECVDSFVIASVLTLKEELGHPLSVSLCKYVESWNDKEAGMR